MSAPVFARVVRLIMVTVPLGASLLLSAGTGWAGGPTSALLVAPGVERAAAVYYSDPEYQQLETLLAEPAVSDAPVELPADGSGYITVTWLIHDVSIWRIDRIYLAANGEHLIATQLMDGTNGNGAGMYPGELGDDTAIKHRAGDPAGLQSLMDKLGLTGSAQAGSADVALQEASGPIDAAPIDAAAASAVPTNPAATAPWWILAGLALGIGVTAAAVRYLPAIRRRLIAEPAGADDEPVRMTRLPV